jgi:hypothetical protein
LVAITSSGSLCRIVVRRRVNGRARSYSA